MKDAVEGLLFQGFAKIRGRAQAQKKGLRAPKIKAAIQHTVGPRLLSGQATHRFHIHHLRMKGRGSEAKNQRKSKEHSANVMGSGFGVPFSHEKIPGISDVPSRLGLGTAE